ncbi:MAG TPA: hypothetical protein VMF29_04235 [Candidatus Edwardsbacteria bacterium]|nr:hypothetical protein [Candidatus Edwardsbacteria bacterium]
MKKLFIAGFCLAVVLSGCTGKSEVKSKGSQGDQPFGVYQSGIDRAKEVQQKSVTRSAAEDSAAAAAKDGAQGQ